MGNSYRYVDSETRFWMRVRKTDGCWIWTGGKLADGYGHMQISKSQHRVHRYSWELAHGPIPNGLQVLHHCDNPSCVRPDHLFLGTNADNQRDKYEKGRSKFPPVLRGSDAIGAKLTEGKALLVRAMYASGQYRHKELAALFGVSNSATEHVVRRRTWRHV